MWALIGTALILAVVAFGAGRPGRPGALVTDRYGAALADTGRLNATLAQGAGVMRVETMDGDRAYEATITHHAGVRIRADYGRGRLVIRDERTGAGGRRTTNDWTVQLTRRVPVELTASTGAGRAAFDLTGMRGTAAIRAGAGDVRLEFKEGPASLDALSLQAGAGRFEAVGLGFARAGRIEARSGVGELHLDFGGAAEGVTHVEVSGGVGKIRITVPDGVGVRLLARRGLTSRLRLPGFTERADGEHVNEAWDGAAARIEIRASLGVGELEIRER